MTDAERACLQRLLDEGPIQREMNPDAIPYAEATELMLHGFIMPGVEVTEGIAKHRVKVWRITDAGRAQLSKS